MQHGAAFHPSLYCLYRQKKDIQTKEYTYFQKYKPDTPRYVQWTVQKVFYHTRRKNPFAYKGLKLFDDTKTLQNIDLQQLSYTIGNPGGSLKSAEFS